MTLYTTDLEVENKIKVLVSSLYGKLLSSITDVIVFTLFDLLRSKGYFAILSLILDSWIMGPPTTTLDDP